MQGMVLQGTVWVPNLMLCHDESGNDVDAEHSWMPLASEKQRAAPRGVRLFRARHAPKYDPSNAPA